MRIRKQVFDLTPSDLSQFPVWEFALDEEGQPGQDEATVRPRESPDPADPGEGMCVVSARFTLAEGSQLHGYLTPPFDDADGLGTAQPVVVTDKGQVGFWYGGWRPSQAELQSNYEKLGRGPNEVFPVAYESTTPVIGGPVAGMIDGFSYYADNGSISDPYGERVVALTR